MDRTKVGTGALEARNSDHVIHLENTGLIPVLDDVLRRLDTILAAGPGLVVVDMSKLGRPSSTTIAALLWIKRRCGLRGVLVQLRSPSRECASLLWRVGLMDASGDVPRDGRLMGELAAQRRTRGTRCATR
jgi:anti-anti-sigma regulatory factor